MSCDTGAHPLGAAACFRDLSYSARDHLTEGGPLLWAAPPAHRSSIQSRLKAWLNSRSSVHPSQATPYVTLPSCQACPSEPHSPSRHHHSKGPAPCPVSLSALSFQLSPKLLFPGGGSAGVARVSYNPIRPPRGPVTPSCLQGFSSHWEDTSHPPAWRPLFPT